MREGRERGSRRDRHSDHDADGFLGLAFLATAQNENVIATRFKHTNQAFYAAEAGLESGLVDLRTLLPATPTPTAAQLAAIAPPTLTDPHYRFNTFHLQRIRPTSYQTTIESGPFAGLFAQTADYEITAHVDGPQGATARPSRPAPRDSALPIRCLLRERRRFGDRPRPPMTFNGRVHANSNIYIRNDTSQFDSFLTTVGDVYRHLKREPGVRGSNPTIKDAGGTYRDLNFDHAHDQDFNNPWTPQEWRQAALTTFDGLVLDSAMGVQEIIPPIPELFYDPVNPEVISRQMIEKGHPADSPAMQAAKPYYEAQLRIEADAAGVITATDQKGDPVSLASCAPGTVSTASFYDKREEATP